MAEEERALERSELRASDADRERVARRLQEAHTEGRLDLSDLDERLKAAYAARTYGELEPLTRDLPVPRTAPAPAASASPVTRWCVLSGLDQHGEWLVPADYRLVAFWGGGKLDLRRARFAGPAVTINLVAVMGGFEVLVPDDVAVQVEGIGVMGAFTGPPVAEAAAGEQVVRVTGFALMGGVEVKRVPRGAD